MKYWSDKFVRNKFERWNLRQRPERRRAGRPKSFTPVQVYERAKLCVPLLISLGSALHKDVLSELVR